MHFYTSAVIPVCLSSDKLPEYFLENTVTNFTNTLIGARSVKEHSFFRVFWVFRGHCLLGSDQFLWFPRAFVGKGWARVELPALLTSIRRTFSVSPHEGHST